MRSVDKYKMLKDSKLESRAKAGTIVYRYGGYDYGCSNDDRRYTGIEHEAMTLQPDGSGPFFTVPVPDMEKQAS